MKNKLSIINIITAAIIVVVLLVSVSISYFTYMSLDFTSYDNEIRLLVAEQRNKIENGIYEKGNYPYIVFNLKGSVLYAEPPFIYKAGESVNVQEMLQFDKSFAHEFRNHVKESFVLQKSGETFGFAVFLIPEYEVFRNSNKSLAGYVFAPVIIGLIITILIIIIRTFYCNRRILQPLKEIAASAKGIIAGNYDLEVLRTYWKTVNENEVGDLTYAFELMRDELKAKQIREEQLKKSQQELISCISHDLKTPISTIRAYSEGLRDGIAKTREKQDEFVKIIIDKTELLTGMINNLLEYSNAQLNQLDIVRKEIYFLDFFIPLMYEIEIFIKQNGLSFSYVGKAPNMLVSIDTKRITEVIYNLVENSIKYTDSENGKIEIKAERQDKFVLIKVMDNGIGISPDDIPYVFDKFYRAEKSRSTSIPGSGLGLSICKYIIEEHGGEVYCKSGYKKGCEIGFTLCSQL